MRELLEYHELILHLPTALNLLQGTIQKKKSDNNYANYTADTAIIMTCYLFWRGPEWLCQSPGHIYTLWWSLCNTTQCLKGAIGINFTSIPSRTHILCQQRWKRSCFVEGFSNQYSPGISQWQEIVIQVLKLPHTTKLHVTGDKTKYVLLLILGTICIVVVRHVIPQPFSF